MEILRYSKNKFNSQNQTYHMKNVDFVLLPDKEFFSSLKLSDPECKIFGYITSKRELKKKYRN